jgi:hypothetical protein
MFTSSQSLSRAKLEWLCDFIPSDRKMKYSNTWSAWSVSYLLSVLLFHQAGSIPGAMPS